MDQRTKGRAEIVSRGGIAAATRTATRGGLETKVRESLVLGFLPLFLLQSNDFVETISVGHGSGPQSSLLWCTNHHPQQHPLGRLAVPAGSRSGGGVWIRVRDPYGRAVGCGAGGIGRGRASADAGVVRAPRRRGDDGRPAAVD